MFISNSRPINKFVTRNPAAGEGTLVGDPNTEPRRKQSTPDETPWFEPLFHNNPALGMNIQDGDNRSWMSGGGAAKVVEDSPWNRSHIGHQRQEWNIGSFVVDPDCAPQFNLLPFSDNSFRVAKMYEARMLGDMFLPLPNQFVLPKGQTPRGGLSMQITGMELGDEFPLTGTPGIVGGRVNLSHDHHHIQHAIGNQNAVGKTVQGMLGPVYRRSHGMPGM